MKDRLEEFVKSHRDEFDLFEPSPSIWNKVEQRVDKEKNRWIRPLLWKAAAVALVFGFSFWAQKQISYKPATREVVYQAPEESPEVTQAKTELAEKTVQHLHKVVPELAETEKFYSNKVNKTMREMKVYMVKYPDVAKDIKKELAELDSVYKNLKKDLGDNVAHEEIINAMIQNYRMKLQILEDIKQQIDQNNSITTTSKPTSHEI